MVSTGDSILVKLTVKEYYRDAAKRPLPAKADTTLLLTYSVKIDSIMTYENYRKWVTNVNSKRREVQMKNDLEVIDQYLADRNIEAEKTEAGLRYVITKRGHGPLPEPGQEVLVNYSGFLLDGTCFFSNVQSIAESHGLDSLPSATYQPLKVVVNKSPVIVGWHLALKVLNKGAKGRFYIPSPLAYGKQKFNAEIKENAILVFDLEIVDIKSAEGSKN